MNKRALLMTTIIVIVLALAGGVYLLYRNTQSDSPANSSNGNTSTSTQQKSEQTQSGDTSPTEKVSYPVKVYFSKHPESDDDPARTFALARVSPDLGVAKFAVTELLKGPTPEEATQGYFSYAKLRNEESNCQGADFTLSISNKTATLQFCKTFDHIGSVSDGQAESVIKDTLNQFDTVDKVVVLNKNGDCEFNLSGLNLCKQ